MKLRFFALIILSVLLFCSCLFKSFNPFFHTEDISFDDRLIGSWIDQDSTKWTFEQFKQEGTFGKKTVEKPYYILKYMEESGKTSLFQVTLFKLDGYFYLDFFPDLETISAYEFLSLHTMPVHTLAKIEFASNQDVRIKWFNEDWLAELIQNGATSIKHQVINYGDDEGTIVLTAPTKDLRVFIQEFGNDPNAFDCEDKFSGDSFCNQLLKIN